MRALVLTACLLAGLFVFAQEPNYTWGEPATNDFQERELEQLLVLDQEGFVLLRTHTDQTFVKHYWIEHYNTSMNLVNSFEIPFNVGVMGDSFFLDHVEVAGGVIYGFVNHWNKAAQKKTLLLKEITLEGEVRDIATLGVIPGKKMGNSGRFIPKFTPDGSKVIVMSEMPFVKKTKEEFSFTAYSLPEGKELWSYDHTSKFESKRAANNDFWVDEDGGILFFKKFWEKPEWQYQVATYSPNTDWQELDVPFQGQVEDFAVELDGIGQFFCFGSYTNEPSAYNRDLHGYIHLSITKDLGLRTANVGAWPKNIVAHFSGDRVAEKADKSRIEDFYIRDIIMRSDGMEYVILEQERSDKKPIAGSSPIQYTYQWNYSDPLVLCMNPETGEMAWWQTFKKQQEVTYNMENDPYGSLVYHMEDDRLFLLYNNTRLSVPSIPPANWTEPDGTKYVKHKAFHDKTMHATFMHVIEPDGSLAYANRTFGLPLFKFHEGAIFEMSLTTP
ncbi:MAG: hypothetical protein HRT74_10305, partial [Flavobacteriales bacterium]|nr:hypothetical protein [Flavobacteriales bacterium]